MSKYILCALAVAAVAVGLLGASARADVIIITPTAATASSSLGSTTWSPDVPSSAYSVGQMVSFVQAGTSIPKVVSMADTRRRSACPDDLVRQRRICSRGGCPVDEYRRQRSMGSARPGWGPEPGQDRPLELLPERTTPAPKDGAPRISWSGRPIARAVTSEARPLPRSSHGAGHGHPGVWPAVQSDWGYGRVVRQAGDRFQLERCDLWCRLRWPRLCSF